MSNSERVVFEADALSFIDAVLHHVTGHRQVTDAYPAALAVSLGLKLATLDDGRASALPDAFELIP